MMWSDIVLFVFMLFVFAYAGITILKEKKSKMVKGQTIRFFYLRDFGTGVPIGVVATDLDKEKDLFKWSYSALHKNDKWDRNLGKKIAVERLAKKPHTLVASSKAQDETFHECIMTELAFGREVPSNVKRCASKYLELRMLTEELREDADSK